jgi:hypothetical protein
VTGPRADWPAAEAGEGDLNLREQVILDERTRRLATVGAMYWFVVVDHWRNGTADITVYEYPTADPTPEGRQVWGCVLDGVRRVEQLVPAAVVRLETTDWRLIGEWWREGDRWLAPVRIENR